MPQFDIYKDYYAVLGVSTAADRKLVDKRYRKLALLFHPDKTSSSERAEHFRAIKEVHRILADEILKKQYDSRRSWVVLRLFYDTSVTSEIERVEQSFPLRYRTRDKRQYLCTPRHRTHVSSHRLSKTLVLAYKNNELALSRYWHNFLRPHLRLQAPTPPAPKETQTRKRRRATEVEQLLESQRPAKVPRTENKRKTTRQLTRQAKKRKKRLLAGNQNKEVKQPPSQQAAALKKPTKKRTRSWKQSQRLDDNASWDGDA